MYNTFCNYNVFMALLIAYMHAVIWWPPVLVIQEFEHLILLGILAFQFQNLQIWILIDPFVFLRYLHWKYTFQSAFVVIFVLNEYVFFTFIVGYMRTSSHVSILTQNSSIGNTSYIGFKMCLRFHLPKTQLT